MTSSPPTVYPSIDWITLTTGPQSDGDEAYARARALAVEQEAAGDDIKPWSIRGYRGFGTPHLRCGARGDDVLVELSGHLADRYWRDFYPLAANVSRFDTCVTVTFLTPTTGLACDGWNAPRVRPRPGLRAIRKTILHELEGGQTLYLGSPKSDRFGRLYDKHHESRGEWPDNSWRWEVQERRHMGSTRAGLLYGADDLHRAIRAGVHGFWRLHGVQPWFDADGVSVHGAFRRTRTDVQRRLGWLEHGVAPAVRKLVDRGHRNAVIRALGLADPERPS